MKCKKKNLVSVLLQITTQVLRYIPHTFASQADFPIALITINMYILYITSHNTTHQYVLYSDRFYTVPPISFQYRVYQLQCEHSETAGQLQLPVGFSKHPLCCRQCLIGRFKVPVSVMEKKTHTICSTSLKYMHTDLLIVYYHFGYWLTV